MHLEIVLDRHGSIEAVLGALRPGARSILDAVLGGLNCAVLLAGASGMGKTYTLYGSEGGKADPLGAPRDEWGVAMRACEAILQRAAPHTLAGPLAASAAGAGGATALQANG